MDANTPRSSLTQSAYEQLRAELLSGRMRPGEKIVIAKICVQLGVSLSAVREALSRLTSEDLVIAEPQRGFKVAPVAIADVHDLTRVRVEIERLCLTHAIAKGSVAWESEILAALHRLNNCVFNPLDVSGEWTALHATFHLRLVSACDSRWLLQIRKQLFDQGERYRRISVRRDERSRDLAGEHAALAHAVVDRNTVQACQLMTDHMLRTEKLTLESLNSQE